MAAKKTAKKKPGRPPKAKGDKPEQFSVRLPPEMKVGLEVYAADNRVSLSSAVESAVAELLSTATLSNGMKVTDVISKVQMEPVGARLINLYAMNPRFVSAEYQGIVGTIFGSVEFREATSDSDEKASVRKQMEVIKFAIDHWTVISTKLGSLWWASTKPVSLRDLVYPADKEGASSKKAEGDFFESLLRRSG